MLFIVKKNVYNNGHLPCTTVYESLVDTVYTPEFYEFKTFSTNDQNYYFTLELFKDSLIPVSWIWNPPRLL